MNEQDKAELDRLYWQSDRLIAIAIDLRTSIYSYIQKQTETIPPVTEQSPIIPQLELEKFIKQNPIARESDLALDAHIAMVSAELRKCNDEKAFIVQELAEPDITDKLAKLREAQALIRKATSKAKLANIKKLNPGLEQVLSKPKKSAKKKVAKKEQPPQA